MKTRIVCLLVLAALAAGAKCAAAKEVLAPTDGARRAKTWAKEMAAFEKQDAAAPPAPGSIIFVGSSSIRMWNLDKWFPDLPVVNRGFGGSTIADSVYFADTLVIKHNPSVIVFYAGDNDLAGGMSPEQVHRDFQEFVSVVRESLPETPIAYVAVKPSIARWKLADEIQAANALIAADCAEDDTLMFLDVWPPMLGADGKPKQELFLADGLHMSDAGYQIWVDMLRPQLDKLLAASGDAQE
ncbi:MAG: hypothetical protein KDA44_20610 [Planctomycetales bacterium]|nr:hypothetical protein [Planctomycetales bacterium]